MIRKLRTRHRWMVLLVAFVTGVLAAVALTGRQAPPRQDAPALGSEFSAPQRDTVQKWA